MTTIEKLRKRLAKIEAEHKPATCPSIDCETCLEYYRVFYQLYRLGEKP